MNISPELVTILVALLINVPTWLMLRANRRKVEAEATSDEGDAVESLSVASKTLVETYNREIVVPMQKRIDELVQQISVIEEDRHAERFKFQSDIQVLQNQVTELLHQVNFMKGELRRSDTALELLLSIAKDTYPNESDRALKIRRGEL